jgi:hypothetical protein
VSFQVIQGDNLEREVHYVSFGGLIVCQDKGISTSYGHCQIAHKAIDVNARYRIFVNIG